MSLLSKGPAEVIWVSDSNHFCARLLSEASKYIQLVEPGVDPDYA